MVGMSSTIIDSPYTLARGPAPRFRSTTGAEVNPQEKLALVIPTLREAENIGGLLDRVRAVLNSLGICYEILIVDDDSCDGTEEIVSALTREDPRVRLLVRRGERGVAGATLHGWRHADATILGVMDADLQHPPEILPELASAILAGNDVAIGSRYAAGGSLGEWNPVRKLLSAVALGVALPVQRKPIRAKDPTSGFFLLRRECLEHVRFRTYGFKLLLEILVRGRIRSIREIPLTFAPRSRGASKATVKVAVDYGRLLARLYAIRLGLCRN
jgi:dolichol-phosphate mannosyltransferase